MGFVRKIVSPAAPRSIKAVSTPPPVVADTSASDAGAAYEQKATNKKGLLSTILSKQRQQHSAHSPAAGNTTLG